MELKELIGGMYHRPFWAARGIFRIARICSTGFPDTAWEIGIVGIINAAKEPMPAQNQGISILTYFGAGRRSLRKGIENNLKSLKRKT